MVHTGLNNKEVYHRTRGKFRWRAGPGLARPAPQRCPHRPDFFLLLCSASLGVHFSQSLALLMVTRGLHETGKVYAIPYTPSSRRQEAVRGERTASGGKRSSNKRKRGGSQRDKEKPSEREKNSLPGANLNFSQGGASRWETNSGHIAGPGLS